MLPANHTALLPDNLRDLYNLYEEHAAWYSGNPVMLSNVYYARAVTPTPRGRFWAIEMRDERRAMVHVPMAADLARVSADLLFSEAPEITIPAATENNPEAQATQERLDLLITKCSLQQRLSEAAETAAALGGVFLKVNWDKSLSEFPIVSIVQPDYALPEFRWGKLYAVTFWTNLEVELEGVVWRLVERHEAGSILSGLYRGTAVNLGGQVDLKQRADTATIPPFVSTGYDRLMCVYVANCLPNRRWRSLPFGRSDYDGLESMMDSLDEAWTSWMRDLRLGAPRIFASDTLVDRDDNGNPVFSIDKEAYVLFNAAGVSSGAIDEQLVLKAFDIRAEEHSQTCEALVRQIIDRAGYSPSAFGMENGNVESGRALMVRERKGLQTAAKKGGYWQPVLEELCEIMLHVDRTHLFGTSAIMRPQVTLQDSIQTTTYDMAETLDMLHRAQSVSTEIKVRMLHPDWQDAQVMEEVARITDETAPPPMPDIEAFGNEEEPEEESEEADA